jgi:hypothetical protein
MARSRRRSETAEPAVPRVFREILESAVAAGGDSLDLEYVPEGLEVCMIAGGTGIGRILDREVGGAVIDFIVAAAALQARNRGTLQIQLGGQSYTLRVESHERFGEWAFRVLLPKSDRR